MPLLFSVNCLNAWSGRGRIIFIIRHLDIDDVASCVANDSAKSFAQCGVGRLFFRYGCDFSWFARKMSRIDLDTPGR
jgi:hypothetical protein